MDGVEIVEYKDEYAACFAQLNIAWLQKYFVVEPIDNEMLSDPKKWIIDPGGMIFFARIGEKIVGTFALIKIENGVYELSKMAVDEHFRGNKIGNHLLSFCIEEGKKLKADKIILYSNTKLEPAIHLYKKFGFKEVALEHSDYARANIKMELNINKA